MKDNGNMNSEIRSDAAVPKTPAGSAVLPLPVPSEMLAIALSSLIWARVARISLLLPPKLFSTQ